MWKKLCAALGILLAVGLLGIAVWLLVPQRQIPSVLESLPADPEDVTDWSNAIAYVPLDDRTDNLEDVIYLAEASGYQIILPPGDSYCTKLDGQALNSSGTQYGDRETLLLWLQEMEAQGCNLYLLSLDQLFSGGLVNSRAVSGTAELAFEDGETMSETEAFDRFVLSLAQDPENEIHLFDSVVRLASTVGYQGFGLTEYYALRGYGMEPRPTLEGEDLTLENVFASYPFGEDGVTAAEEGMEEYRDALTPEMIRNYLGVRQRKLRLTDYVINALKTAEHRNIHLLIGIDDSSNANNIQYNELSYITKQAGQGTTLLTGLDSLARLLVGQIAQNRYGRQVKTYLRYIGGSESIPSSEYDVHTLEKTVDLHMDLFQAQRVTDASEAELQLLVMTAPDDPARAEAYCEELVSQLEENAKNRVPTILLEASNNAYGEQLEQMLFDRVDFANLLAFAGKYDQANVTGAAFAMGFSRYLYLACAPEKDDACDEAQVRQLANSMALTYPYILHTRYELNLFIEKLGGNYNNIAPSRPMNRLVQSFLEHRFLPRCGAVLENLEGARLISSLAPYEEKVVNGVAIRDVYLPWNRTFELSFTVDVEPLTPVDS